MGEEIKEEINEEMKDDKTMGVVEIMEERD